jgi:hypothetical protein
MLVADLTGNNANVFYELAIRHAIRKPYVQIIQKGERIPFDVAGIRTIELDHTNLDSVAAAKDEIKRQMEFSAANIAKIESPISVALDLASLTQSENPVERQIAEVLTGIGEVKRILDDRFEFVVDTLADLKEELLPGTSVVDGTTAPVIDIMEALKQSLKEKRSKPDQQRQPPTD